MEQVMSRGSNPAKVQQWTDRLERYRRSGQSVAEFCLKEGVSAPSFYQWKKKLAEERKADQAGRPVASKAGQPAELAPRQGRLAPTRSGFQSVELLPAASSATTVRLPNGIEIDLGSDLRVIRLLVKQLLERSADSRVAGDAELFE
jgi:transposase-like protein